MTSSAGVRMTARVEDDICPPVSACPLLIERSRFLPYPPRDHKPTLSSTCLDHCLFVVEGEDSSSLSLSHLQSSLFTEVIGTVLLPGHQRTISRTKHFIGRTREQRGHYRVCSGGHTLSWLVTITRVFSSLPVTSVSGSLEEQTVLVL